MARVGSDTVQSATSIAVVTATELSPSQEFDGLPVTSLPRTWTAQFMAFHVDRVIKGDLPSCLTDFVVVAADLPRTEVGQRFLWFGYTTEPTAGYGSGDAETERRSGTYAAIPPDGTMVFGRDGERRSVDAWQPSQHELYDPISVCPGGPGDGDPKDCPTSPGIP